jgi:heme iron utilization protein
MPHYICLRQSAGLEVPRCAACHECLPFENADTRIDGMAMKPADPPPRSDSLGAARSRARELLHTSRSLMLGTIDAAGVPLVSYAPFARDDSGDFLIAVSALAAHQPALATADRVSVMLIEDEAAARQIFARTRLSLECEIKPSPGPDRSQVFAALRERFGEIADLLEGLGDFHAYRLTPRRGQFVTGFGAAFILPDGRIDAMEHVRIGLGPGGKKA